MDPEKIKMEGERNFSRATSVAIAIVSVLLGLLLAQYIMRDSGGLFGGATRNCIKSALGNLPDCSDGRGGDGSSKQTTVNGKSMGVCRNVSVSGECIK